MRCDEKKEDATRQGRCACSRVKVHGSIFRPLRVHRVDRLMHPPHHAIAAHPIKPLPSSRCSFCTGSESRHWRRWTAHCKFSSLPAYASVSKLCQPGSPCHNCFIALQDHTALVIALQQQVGRTGLELMAFASSLAYSLLRRAMMRTTVLYTSSCPGSASPSCSQLGSFPASFLASIGAPCSVDQGHPAMAVSGRRAGWHITTGAAVIARKRCIVALTRPP